jgi:hypothetical protein
MVNNLINSIKLKKMLINTILKHSLFVLLLYICIMLYFYGDKEIWPKEKGFLQNIYDIGSEHKLFRTEPKLSVPGKPPCPICACFRDNTPCPKPTCPEVTCPSKACPQVSCPPCVGAMPEAPQPKNGTKEI